MASVALAGGFFTASATWEALLAELLSQNLGTILDSSISVIATCNVTACLVGITFKICLKSAQF